MSQSMNEKVTKAMIKSYNDTMDKHVRPITYEEVLNDPRHGTIQAAQAAIDIIKAELNDHYWDSLQSHKDIILLHINEKLL
jgi:hypothetical protein